MNEKTVELRIRVLLTLQVALLGMVTDDMRSVAVAWNDSTVRVRVLFKGPLLAEHAELVSEIETEIMSHLPEQLVQCTAEVATLGKASLRDGESLVFQRARDR